MVSEEQEDLCLQLLNELIDALHNLPSEDQDVYFLFAYQALEEECQAIKKRNQEKEAFRRKIAEIRERIKRSKEEDDKKKR